MTSQMNRSSLFNEMISLPEAVSSLFENSFLNPNWSNSFEQQKLMTAFNVYEDATNFYVLGMLPGLDPEKFELNVKENILTVSGTYSFTNWPQATIPTSGEKDKQAKDKGPAVRPLLKEIPEGQFYRQIQLPSAFDSEKIEAHYEDGLLKLLLPKTQSSQTRRIPIQTGKRSNFMEGQLVAAGKNNDN